ncbi:sensor histidine kinase [Natranaeroarchaeum aerophilus]|uniref:histidine kinase n=1 Tax=Natranaeroarchaeum aerophilus TaxID=2917711 RepID=A0AAE3FQ71_9EURY|nr:PAS domain-containing sensor histidine kinase [Natranaeroarchaeum aerophilus]MCL9813156.1 PAS domain-containing sensor histidine kinase [Natranaeroarchaeum aerophilus]
MTDHSSVERFAETRPSRSTPAVVLLADSEDYRTKVQSALSDTVPLATVDTPHDITISEFDLAIVAEGKLPDGVVEGQRPCKTPILYITADESSVPPCVWRVITDVVRPCAPTSSLSARIHNTLSNPSDRRAQDGLVGIDCVPDPTVSVDVIDGSRFVRHANTAFETEFGFDPGDVTDRRLEELIVPDVSREYTTDLTNRAVAGETIERVLRRDTRHGRRDYLVRMVESHHCEADLWITYTDVTNKRCREQQVKVLNRVLRHNLRNDMNVILGNVERLLSKVDDQRAAEVGEEIRQAAESLVGLGDTASTLRETWDSVDPTAIDLVQVAERVRRDVRRQTPSAEIQLTTPERCWVSGDSRLVAAVSELVENAIDHTPSGTDIGLRVESGGDWARISVLDDGPGLPQSERAVLNGDAETPLDHGSGLGLWIVNWIVSISGGQLEVDVEEESGTAVTISLPAADVETE